MTPVSRNNGSGGKAFARLATSLTLTLVVFAVATWSQGQVEAHYRGGGYDYFESRLAQMYYHLSARINYLNNIVRELGRQQCQTGTLDFSICPSFKEANLTTITSCVVSPVAGADASVIDMTVTFASPFKKPPVVDVSYSGLALLNGKNCSVEVLSVSKNQVVVRHVADDLLPIATQVTYYACPSAIFPSTD